MWPRHFHVVFGTEFAVIKKMADVDFTTMLCEPELVMITARTVLFAYINLGIINIISYKFHGLDAMSFRVFI